MGNKDKQEMVYVHFYEFDIGTLHKCIYHLLENEIKNRGLS